MTSSSEQDLKLAPFATILLIILKELRIEKGLRQAALADLLHKTPSSLAKIENGQTSLNVETLCSICGVLYSSPSAVFAAAERYSAYLSQSGIWQVLYNSPSKSEKDDLIDMAQEYYSSNNFNNQAGGTPYQITHILNTPFQAYDGSWIAKDIFLFLTDQAIPKRNLY